jgi:hypothetical protein
MEGLSESESAFFKSGGAAELPDAEETETTDVVETVETKTEEKVEVKEEKKSPSQFKYSADTDNVVDEHGRKYIPLGAVQEARNENKGLRKELEELKTKWTGGEQRLNKLMEALSGKEEAPPDYEKDPLGNLKAKNDALEAKIKALEGNTEETKKASEVSANMAKFQNAVTSAERGFAAKNPDYAEAVQHLSEAWRAELEEAGADEDQIDALLSRKGAQFSYAAMQKGRNPAEAVYNAAKRLGYKPAEPKENKDKETLKTIAKGQEAEKSLSNGKGNSNVSLEAIASMSDEDMDEFVKDPKNWKKLAKG